MKNFFAFVFMFIISLVSIASTGGHEEAGIPFEKIGWQAANLGILLIVLFFLIKNSIKDAFINRRKSFIEQSEKTKNALLDAENTLKGIKEKLTDLEKSEISSISKAKQEASLLKEQIINEATLQSEKLKKESDLFLSAELNKAKKEISEEMLKSAIKTATSSISSQNKTTKEIEQSFLNQISQVH